jgi:alkanesulfonate monooxygenase SsuD/methylene tetrahydromethanopterin reductase-like flavin-dependent oxidoreductase (luciferase family)
MRVGLHALGIGSGADPAVITAVARAAEESGFATLWAGEHVVMIDGPGSRYPYADDDVSTYAGATVRFDAVRWYPKPVRRSVPVFFGGNGDRALQRVAGLGDGWYGFNVPLDELAERLEFLRSACREATRPTGSVETAAAVSGARPADLPQREALGLDEFVVVEGPPDRPEDAAPWVAGLARRWKV